MVQRVLMGRRTDGTFGLDISLPGYDVMSASQQNLAFSSRWGNAANVHQMGFCPYVTYNPGGPAPYVVPTVITFPTLPYVPMVMFFPYYSQQTVIYYQTGSSSDSGGQTIYANNIPALVVTTSQFTVEFPPAGWSNSHPIWDGLYIVLKIPGGR